jgi:hypothetical protein
LFDDIEFLTASEVREIGSPEVVSIPVGNMELAAIHQNMGRSLIILAIPF